MTGGERRQKSSYHSTQGHFSTRQSFAPSTSAASSLHYSTLLYCTLPVGATHSLPLYPLLSSTTHPSSHTIPKLPLKSQLAPNPHPHLFSSRRRAYRPVTSISPKSSICHHPPELFCTSCSALPKQSDLNHRPKAHACHHPLLLLLSARLMFNCPL